MYYRPSRLLKFDDDTKVFANVENQDNVEQLRKDLTAMYQLTVDWQMLFSIWINVWYCTLVTIMVITNHEYRMGGITLESVCQERDLGVLVDSGLKFSHQCVKAVSEAKRTLRMIKRSLTNTDSHTTIALYQSLVSAVVCGFRQTRQS